MHEARKLDDQLPEIPVDQSGPSGPEAVLPPFPAADQPARAAAATSTPRSERRDYKNLAIKKKGGWGRALLMLCLVSIVSFAGTASLTAGIVLGNFDMKSGKFKEAIKDVKVLMRQLRN